MKKFMSIVGILLQFFPLMIFLRVALLHGAPQILDWLYAFIWGGGAAILQLALFLFFARGYPLNRIILGVNLYLMLGGGAVLSSQMLLLEMLNDLKESSIFLCLLIVGISTTIASKAGFVGVVAPAKQRDVRRYSMYLLGLTCVALAASFWFKGQITISAAVPLIVISVATRLFKRQLQRGEAPNPLPD